MCNRFIRAYKYIYIHILTSNINTPNNSFICSYSMFNHYLINASVFFKDDYFLRGVVNI